jgi:glycosyltransferase involved in cell wall biosynthesis
MADSVDFVGPVVGADKVCILRQADVFLFPSHYESWGHVALEAMAAGTPVVGYDIPSSREAFGDAMFTVPLGDRAAFAACALSLMDDRDLHDRAAAASKAFARAHSWDSIATSLLARLP